MDTSGSKRLYGESVGMIPGGVSSPVRAFSPYPLFMERAKGCTITDTDGNTYTDLCMAYGPLIAGHACDRVLDAARRQMSAGTVYGTPSVPELDLVKRINSLVPSAESVRLTSSGTEATMHAIRLARGYTGKDGLMMISGGFHGSHDSVLSSAGVPQDTLKNTHRVEFNDAAALESALDRDEGIGCLIMEPVMGNSGVILPRRGYLEEVRRITREHGVVLVFDEVITGFRLSSGGAQKLFGVTPDLTTAAKIMGGGFPGGAFMGRKDIMDMIAPAGPVYAAGTFSGNPVSAAAGLAQISLMCEHDRYRRLDRTASDLASCLRDLMADRCVRGCVQGIGSMLSVFFGVDEVKNGSDAAKTDRSMFGRLFKHMLDHGIYLPPSALEVWFLSVAHDAESARKVTDAFDGFLAGEAGC